MVQVGAVLLGSSDVVGDEWWSGLVTGDLPADLLQVKGWVGERHRQ